MPLAILLQEQLSVLTKGLKKVERWEAATETFSRVVDRLRSAYLVRWFGTPLPTVGLALRVAFVNMDDLRRRWFAVGPGRGTAAPPIGPNLTEPLLGASGTLVGVFATPMYGLLLGLALGTLFENAYVRVLAVVNWLTAGLLGSGVLGVAGVGGGIALLLGLSAWAISGQGREAFDLLGAIAELVEPLQRFWRQVTGPREAVRNPLLREILVLGDRSAALVALLLGGFAVLVTRVGPLLEPLRAAFAATVGLVRELWAVISYAFLQTADFLKGLLSGPDSIPKTLGRVVMLLTRAFRRLGTSLKDLWNELRWVFRVVGLFAGRLFDRWLKTGLPFVRSQTIDHPTIAFIRSFVGTLQVVSAWSARKTEPEPQIAWPRFEPRWWDLPARLRTLPERTKEALTFALPLVIQGVGRWFVGKLAPPPLPRFPTLPPGSELLPLRMIGPLARLAGRLGSLVPNPLELGDEATAVLRRAQRPRSVFADEWAALRAEARRPEPLARTLETAAYLSLARRVISPVAAERVRELEDLLSRIDASIRAQRARLPVKDVPEPTALNPSIRTLRVLTRGRAPEAVRTWVEELGRQLNAAPYPAPVEG
jgi:hypothetical protein